MKDMIEHLEVTKMFMFLGMAYIPSAIVYMRKGEYQKTIDILFKSKKILSDVGFVSDKDSNEEASFLRILIALSKRALGNENKTEIKKLKRILKENNNIQPSTDFYHDYHKYEFYGSEKGKVFLKFAYDKVQEIKSNLKGESLKDFLDAYYVKLILSEWNKIGN